MIHMKKTFLLALAIATIVSMCAPSATAHEHVEFAPITSAWASNEIQHALELGIVPVDYLPSDYRAPISRAQFRCIAMNYIALQENCGLEVFKDLVGMYKAEKNADGTIKTVFSDGSQDDSLAYYLNLVEGRGDGRFDPDGNISRQEAAVMLTRAYQVYGGNADIEHENLKYIDSCEIASWARESVSVLTAWDIMNGLDNDTFSPNEQYSIEQCIVTFLRLYERAPVSLKNENIVPMFSYAQCMDYLESITAEASSANAGDAIITEIVDGLIATYVRLDISGVMLGTATMYFVYKDGGIKPVDFGICSYPTPQNIIYSSLQTVDSHFSEGGNTFYCYAVLPQDSIYTSITGEQIVAHASGEYYITIDVKTNSLIECKLLPVT